MKYVLLILGLCFCGSIQIAFLSNDTMDEVIDDLPEKVDRIEHRQIEFLETVDRIEDRQITLAEQIFEFQNNFIEESDSFRDYLETQNDQSFTTTLGFLIFGIASQIIVIIIPIFHNRSTKRKKSRLKLAELKETVEFTISIFKRLIPILEKIENNPVTEYSKANIKISIASLRIASKKLDTYHALSLPTSLQSIIDTINFHIVFSTDEKNYPQIGTTMNKTDFYLIQHCYEEIKLYHEKLEKEIDDNIKRIII